MCVIFMDNTWDSECLWVRSLIISGCDSGVVLSLSKNCLLEPGASLERRLENIIVEMFWNLGIVESFLKILKGLQRGLGWKVWLDRRNCGREFRDILVKLRVHLRVY